MRESNRPLKMTQAHILIVDDEPDIRELVRDILEDEGRDLHFIIYGLCLLSRIHDEVKNSIHLVLELISFLESNLFGSKEGLDHLRADIDLKRSHFSLVIFDLMALEEEFDVGTVRSGENKVVNGRLKGLNNRLPL